MSDEEVLGTVCYIPARLYLLAIAIGFAVYGAVQLFYFMIVVVAMQGRKMTPNHCSGFTCTEVVSCDATRNSSYEVYMFIMVIGSLVMGLSGIQALMNKYSKETFNFALWLVAVVWLTTTVTIVDCVYDAVCGAYSYNVIYEVIAWTIPNWIVNDGVKYEVKEMHSYPVGYINKLCNMSVLFVYIFLQSVKIIFFLYASWTAKLCSERFHYGITGMGANFSIAGWRERLKLRDETDEVIGNTVDMMAMSCMDLDWDRKDWEERRPLCGRRQRHWYRGFVPGSYGARAYDGFNDNRRNVLL